MARHNAKISRASDVLEVKSKYEAEFRRFSVSRCSPLRLCDFSALVLSLHGLGGGGGGAGPHPPKPGSAHAPPGHAPSRSHAPGPGHAPNPARPGHAPPRGPAQCGVGLAPPRLSLSFTDAQGELLPLTSDERLRAAVARAAPVLRLVLQRSDEEEEVMGGGGSLARRKRGFPARRSSSATAQRARPHLPIGRPQDFRAVCSVIDVHLLPASVRRVRLHRPPSLPHLPLGFFIRAGGPPADPTDRSPARPAAPRTAAAKQRQQLSAAPAAGVFISRLLDGGLAHATGLLAIDDQVLEVNGIDVTGKSLDQVTDMMVANSHNLVVTVRPANQLNNVVPRAGQTTNASTVAAAKERGGSNGELAGLRERRWTNGDQPRLPGDPGRLNRSLGSIGGNRDLGRTENRDLSRTSGDLDRTDGDPGRGEPGRAINGDGGRGVDGDLDRTKSRTNNGDLDRTDDGDPGGVGGEPDRTNRYLDRTNADQGGTDEDLDSTNTGDTDRTDNADPGDTNKGNQRGTDEDLDCTNTGDTDRTDNADPGDTNTGNQRGTDEDLDSTNTNTGDTDRTDNADPGDTNTGNRGGADEDPDRTNAELAFLRHRLCGDGEERAMGRRHGNGDAIAGSGNSEEIDDEVDEVVDATVIITL